MDRLEYLLNKQKELHIMLGQKREWYNDATLNDKILIFVDAMIDECSEIKQGLNWKPWKNKEPIDHDYIKEELIDILHFWLDAANQLDMNSYEILEKYDAKHKENQNRQIDGGKDGRSNYVVRGH